VARLGKTDARHRGIDSGIVVTRGNGAVVVISQYRTEASGPGHQSHRITVTDRSYVVANQAAHRIYARYMSCGVAIADGGLIADADQPTDKGARGIDRPRRVTRGDSRSRVGIRAHQSASAIVSRYRSSRMAIPDCAAGVVAAGQSAGVGTGHYISCGITVVDGPPDVAHDQPTGIAIAARHIAARIAI